MQRARAALRAIRALEDAGARRRARMSATDLEAPADQADRTQPLLPQQGRSPGADDENGSSHNGAFRRAAGNVVAAAAATRTLASAGGRTMTEEEEENLIESLRRYSWGYPMGVGAALKRHRTCEPPGPPGFFAPVSDSKALLGMIFGSWMNILLLAIPLGIASELMSWGAKPTFFLNFVALVPLALLLGEVTEDLAVRFGDTIGGLLNATFGNVVEMILSLAALTKGLNTVVASSLIGSVLSNLLLVLGMCFLLGGSRYKVQNFNVVVNKASCGVLLLACIALLIPTAANYLYAPDRLPGSSLQHVSIGTAILLAVVYGCYLLFQLKTHGVEFAEEGETEAPALSLSASIGLLTVITAIVALCSEFLTGAIEEVSKETGLNQSFLGLILLPIAGNAAEHITAVFVAMKNKMDLAIGVALGSSIQIAVFAFPVVVLFGAATGHPFSLVLDPFAILILTLAVLHAYIVSADGHSNWLSGVQLVGTYVLVGLLYVFLRDAPAAPAPASAA